MINLREGVINPWVGLLKLIFIQLCQFPLLYHVRVLVQDLGYAHSIPQGVIVPENVVRREANHADNERRQARKAKEAA
jgi:hypothetical protein